MPQTVMEICKTKNIKKSFFIRIIIVRMMDMMISAEGAEGG